VETLQHDILAGPLPSGEFDLVHARLLVEHLGPAALPNLCAGLRPGGVLLLEDFDMACKGAHPDDPAFLDGVDGVIGVMASSGFDPFIGRKLPAMLESAGLVDVEAEGRVRLVRSATPEADFSRLSMLALRQRLVAGGRLTEAQLDAALQWHDVPGRAAFSPVMVACWGRRPLTG
jgi:SAM-dependent methyltransferase